MEQEFVLQIADKKQSKNYTITSAMRLIIGGKIIEMVETVNASISLVTCSDEKIVFHYIQTGSKRESTNEEFFSWASIVNSILEDIKITCDNTGKIIRVSISDLDKNCSDIHKQLKIKYKDRKSEINELMKQIDSFVSDNKKVVKQLNESGFHRVLFNGHYGKYTADKITEEKKVIEKLVNGIDIPLMLEKEFTIDEREHKHTLKINGALDIESFDKKTLSRWLKDMTDTYNLKVDCGADIEEIFVFDKDHWLQKADSYFSFLATNLYECSYAYQVVQDKMESIPENANVRVNNWILPNN